MALHEDLGLSKCCARWVPCLLTDEHKEKRMVTARKFKNLVQKHSMHFLRTLINTDENWVSFSTPETKEQSCQWLPRGSAPPVKAKKAASEKKVMVITFFDSRGLVYTHYVPQGQTANAAYFMKVLKTFLVHVCTKRHDLWATKSWWLHMDNARPHTAKATMDFIESKGIKLVTPPLIS